MENYVCHYKVNTGAEAQATYRADSLPSAMALGNSVRAEHASSVLKWVGPTGITFLMHDSSLKVEA